MRIKPRQKSSEEENNNNQKILDRMPTAEQYRNAFINFTKEGWNPDVVVSHSGWGCGFFVKEVWPNTKLISYLSGNNRIQRFTRMILTYTRAKHQVNKKTLAQKCRHKP